MSGGSYDYKYINLIELADMLDPPKRDGYEPIRNRLGKALRSMSEQCKIVEWIDSGDYGDDDFKQVENWLEEHKFN